MTNPDYKALTYSYLDTKSSDYSYMMNRYKDFKIPYVKPTSVATRYMVDNAHIRYYGNAVNDYKDTLYVDSYCTPDEAERTARQNLQDRKDRAFVRVKSGVTVGDEKVPRYSPTREAVFGTHYDPVKREAEFCIYFKPEKIQHDDVQCVLGMKILDNTTSYAGNRPYHSKLSVPHHRHPQTRDTIMSVVYISRQDGKLCCDSYLLYCEETKLLFPEQLKHTSLRNDVAWSEQNIINSLKTHVDMSNLSLFDAVRRKKAFLWFVPSTKWDTAETMHEFTHAHKSTYKKPNSISTWRKRRAMARRTR